MRLGIYFATTPWYDEEIPFVEAAEIGTEKVIKDHSTIGIIITSDGSFGEFERGEYTQVEERIVGELTEINKPFIVVLNISHPNHPETEELARDLKDKYMVPVLPINVENMTDKDITNILREALYEFSVMEVKVNMPEWIGILSPNHYVKCEYIEKMKESVVEIDKLRDINSITSHFNDSTFIEKAYLSQVDPATGEVIITLDAPKDLFSTVLNEMIGIDVSNKAQLLGLFQDYNESKKEYDQIKIALQMVKTTGYGVANPTLADMKLDTPEITKQGSRYGIKLKAVAPSIHMIKVDVESTFEPIIGSEMQSKELISYLMKDHEVNPANIWKSEIFGRSLDVIVQEGIQSKISMMPENIKYKLQQTLCKTVNKGSNKLIAIVI